MGMTAREQWIETAAQRWKQLQGIHSDAVIAAEDMALISELLDAVLPQIEAQYEQRIEVLTEAFAKMEAAFTARNVELRAAREREAAVRAEVLAEVQTAIAAVEFNGSTAPWALQDWSVIVSREHTESDAEAIAHEIAMHFANDDWQQCLAAGRAAVRRIERNRSDFEYAVRKDWSFTQGVETIMPVGADLNVARALARVLDEMTDDPNHSVLRRRAGTSDWHEWGDENARRRGIGASS